MNPSPTPAPPTRGSLGRLLAVLLVIVLVILVIAIDMKRRAAEHQLKTLTMKLQELTGGNPSTNKEAARRVTDAVRKLYALPEGIEPTVATIVDVTALRKQNHFYDKAENGYHLVITTDRAILYDPARNMIVDVVPVSIQPPAQAGNPPTPPAAAPTAPAAKPPAQPTSAGQR
ncbi:hypothetical protein HY285_02185 [Candidatus Peregrinibacteria bacterium]|nr:hypothetical protein [Candidatus Peregrinibacteria bacterium]